ncbi:MAG: hypothetical protein H6Q69_412 [Firmicutes bacterium]|nr:hypothetical protein [Bacillota bacterium]
MILGSPLLKLAATRLKPIGPEKAMECAVGVGSILAHDLSSDEQETIGNAFVVIGAVLLKASNTQRDKVWNQATDIELAEIEMEILLLQKRIDKQKEELQNKKTKPRMYKNRFNKF